MQIPLGLNFNPLPSYEGRRAGATAPHHAHQFQSTPLIRGETRHPAPPHRQQRISIHSPHTRGDSPAIISARVRPHFNPLPSYEGRHCWPPTPCHQRNFNPLPSYEGRRKLANMSQAQAAFQSTPLIRGETVALRVCVNAEPDFNPLPSYEGRLKERGFRKRPSLFQSTPLIRGETIALPQLC